MKTTTLAITIVGTIAAIFTLTVATAVAGIAALAMLGSTQYGQRIEFKNIEIYYTSQVTEAEAEKFVKHLENSHDGSTHRITFQLDRKDGNFLVRMVAKEFVYTTNQADDLIQGMRDEIQAECYPTEVVVFEACDDRLRTKKTWHATAQRNETAVTK